VNGTVRFLLHYSLYRKGYSGGTGEVQLMHNCSKQVTNLPVNNPDLTAHNEEIAGTLHILEIRVIRYNHQLVIEHASRVLQCWQHIISAGYEIDAEPIRHSIPEG
jgi:hypothetical protein